MKFNKTITELRMIDVNVSPSDYLLLADVLTMNTSIKKIFWLSLMDSEKRFDQSLVFTVPETIRAQLHTGIVITVRNK